MNETTPDIERHPWPPFIPEGARVLFMGTFPPQPKRWSMDFYYPNPTNDFWRIMALIFLGDAGALNAPSGRGFDLDAITNLLRAKHIALNDTGRAVRRLRDNASDKYLDIVEPVDLRALLQQMPQCRAVATTGMKAAEVIASITATAVPPMGGFVEGDGFEIWRMPSTSRAYPMSLARKADYYRTLFTRLDII